MSDYNPITHVVVHRHHVFGVFIAFLLALGIVGLFAYAKGGRFDMVNGKPVITVPDLSDIKPVIQFKTNDGKTVDATVQPVQVAAQSPQPPVVIAPQAQVVPQAPVVPQVQPAPNGTTVADSIGPDGKLQRSETDRYDLIAKLNEKLAAIKVEDETLKQQMAALEQKQATPAPALASQPTAAPSVQVQQSPVAPAQQSAQVNYTGVPTNWHIQKVNGEAKADSCAAQGGTLVLSDVCERLAGGGKRCKWTCRH